MQDQSQRKAPVGELVCAGSLLILGISVVVYGARYPLIANGVVGPGLMPIISGVVLAAAAMTLLWRILATFSSGAVAVRSELSEVDSNGDALPLDEDGGEVAGNPKAVLGIFILLALTVVLAPIFGLVPMLGVLVFVSVFIFEREGLLRAMVMTVGITALSWIVFGWIFDVPLPTGSLWQELAWPT